jgi:hypothetical protein
MKIPKLPGMGGGRTASRGPGGVLPTVPASSAGPAAKAPAPASGPPGKPGQKAGMPNFKSRITKQGGMAEGGVVGARSGMPRDVASGTRQVPGDQAPQRSKSAEELTRDAATARGNLEGDLRRNRQMFGDPGPARSRRGYRKGGVVKAGQGSGVGRLQRSR